MRFLFDGLVMGLSYNIVLFMSTNWKRNHDRDWGYSPK